MSPPYSGWGWQITTPAGGDGGRARSASRLKSAPTDSFTGCSGIICRHENTGGGLARPMVVLTCLLTRRRIGAHLDGALENGPATAMSRHLSRCAKCQGEAENIRRVRALLQRTLSLGQNRAEPDWSGLWPGIVRGIEDAFDHDRPVPGRAHRIEIAPGDARIEVAAYPAPELLDPGLASASACGGCSAGACGSSRRDARTSTCGCA